MARSTFIIAEIGVNHDGSIDKAIQLIDAAADSGADAAKFQSFSVSRLATRDAPTAEYQKRAGFTSSQAEMLRRLEFSEREFELLKQHCDSRSIEFMSTAFDREWLRFLVQLGIRRIKWPSGELTNHPFLRFAANFDLPIIMSTGMATLGEIQVAVGEISEVRTSRNAEPLGNNVTILHCTSLYPAPIETLNLKAIQTIRDAFGLPVGYSDHSRGLQAAPLAVALGATVIEKHITYDPSAVGPDHHASLSGSQFKSLVSAIRETEIALGDGDKRPASDEAEVAVAARRSLYVNRLVRAGEQLVEGLFDAKRPGDGVSPSELSLVLGRRAVRDLEPGHKLIWEDIE